MTKLSLCFHLKKALSEFQNEKKTSDFRFHFYHPRTATLFLTVTLKNYTFSVKVYIN